MGTFSYTQPCLQQEQDSPSRVAVQNTQHSRRCIDTTSRPASGRSDPQLPLLLCLCCCEASQASGMGTTTLSAASGSTGGMVSCTSSGAGMAPSGIAATAAAASAAGCGSDTGTGTGFTAATCAAAAALAAAASRSSGRYFCTCAKQDGPQHSPANRTGNICSVVSSISSSTLRCAGRPFAPAATHRSRGTASMVHQGEQALSELPVVHALHVLQHQRPPPPRLVRRAVGHQGTPVQLPLL